MPDKQTETVEQAHELATLRKSLAESEAREMVLREALTKAQSVIYDSLAVLLVDTDMGRRMENVHVHTTGVLASTSPSAEQAQRRNRQELMPSSHCPACHEPVQFSVKSHECKGERNG